MSQLGCKVSSELVFDPVLLYSFLPSDGSSSRVIENNYFRNGYFYDSYLGRMASIGYIRKVSRYLSSYFKLTRMERYAEQVRFQLKDNFVFVKSKYKDRVLNCIEVPFGEDVFPSQMKVFLQVYFNYKIDLSKAEKFEEREPGELPEGMDLQHVLGLALQIRVGKFVFDNA